MPVDQYNFIILTSPNWQGTQTKLSTFWNGILYCSFGKISFCIRKITEGKYEDKEEPHRSFEGHSFGVYMVRWLINVFTRTKWGGRSINGFFVLVVKYFPNFDNFAQFHFSQGETFVWADICLLLSWLRCEGEEKRKQRHRRNVRSRLFTSFNMFASFDFFPRWGVGPWKQESSPVAHVGRAPWLCHLHPVDTRLEDDLNLEFRKLLNRICKTVCLFV